jgi:hypothetical protein
MVPPNPALFHSLHAVIPSESANPELPDDRTKAAGARERIMAEIANKPESASQSLVKVSLLYWGSSFFFLHAHKLWWSCVCMGCLQPASQPSFTVA